MRLHGTQLPWRSFLRAERPRRAGCRPAGKPAHEQAESTVDGIYGEGYNREFSILSSPGLKRSLVCISALRNAFPSWPNRTAQ